MKRLWLSLLTAAGLCFCLSWRGAAPATLPDDADDCDAPEAKADPLVGVWSKYENGPLGAPVRFYYFHGDGIGLYRYGKVGLTNTNSYDYEIKGDALSLTFRKTGARHQVRFRMEPDPNKKGRDWLVLEGDPRDPGARYFRDKAEPVSESANEPLLLPGFNTTDGAQTASPSGRMWINLTHYATGGAGFAIYQFREAGIDGRGAGWFHQGDFDDWSTESLAYRLFGDKIELAFELRRERAISEFCIKGEGKDRRFALHNDPREFWLKRAFQDMGKSF
jgi:hypothetical protein